MHSVKAHVLLVEYLFGSYQGLVLPHSRQALYSSHFTCVLPGGVQLICNNMVTSTRAIVNTARSMVSTIMKFLDSGPGKAADGNLKARVMTSEPDNAEGLHNFAPLGAFKLFLTQLLQPTEQYFYSNKTSIQPCINYFLTLTELFVSSQAPSHPAALQHSQQRSSSKPHRPTGGPAQQPGPTSSCRRRPGVTSPSTFPLLCC